MAIYSGQPIPPNIFETTQHEEAPHHASSSSTGGDHQGLIKVVFAGLKASVEREPSLSSRANSSSAKATVSHKSEKELFPSFPWVSFHRQDIKLKRYTTEERKEVIEKLSQRHPLEKAPYKTGVRVTDPATIHQKQGMITSQEATKSFGRTEFYALSAAGLKYGGIKNEDRVKSVSMTVASGGKEIAVPFWGIYDGHGGTATSNKLRDIMDRIVEQCLSQVDIHDPLQVKQALKVAFLEADRVCGRTDYDGATALVTFIINNELWVANAGDCRAVLSKDGEAIQLSRDSIPAEEPFLSSLQKRELEGGYQFWANVTKDLIDLIDDGVVFHQGGNTFTSLEHPSELGIVAQLANSRVLDPSLNMRHRCQPGGGIGDPQLLLPSRPKVNRYPLTDLDPTKVNYLILGTDGVFDSIDSEEIPSIIKPHRSIQEITEDVVDAAFSMGPERCDNTSVIAIKL